MVLQGSVKGIFYSSYSVVRIMYQNVTYTIGGRSKNFLFCNVRRVPKIQK